MSHDRLTRQELSWLLAQEARGAAKALRDGVSQLKQPGAGKPAPVETTLDALDDAIGMLTELQSGQGKGRRGRIDLAALLYELAPEARISIEPGAGTEVFGEESELRRMLHVLVSQTNASPSGTARTSSPEVHIRRQDDMVKISVDLGPDTSATLDIERRWLGRMATRHGGRLELEGGTQSVLLPADGASDQREVVELRKELEQAQQLGAAYARELATAFNTGELAQGRESFHGEDVNAERFELMTSLARAQARMLRGWLEALKGEVAKAASAAGAPAMEALELRVKSGQDFVAELTRVADCPLDEPIRTTDAAKLLREVAGAVEARAARLGVGVELKAPAKLEASLSTATFTLLVRSLLDHAITATRRDDHVLVELSGEGGSLELRVEDGGPLVPAPVRSDVLRYRTDPSSVGRPTGLALLVADTAAGFLGGKLRLVESASGRMATEFVRGG